ncbi:MAG: DUF4065 domain-containing protein [Treponema sp.]|jgi:uncharacterized phage-associated protein|nr:DUF4065 domain-containing protein [Treponema sp.]
MADISDVVTFFIDYSQKTGDEITNMRLNKLLYFACGIHLLRTKEALFQEPIEAWDYGPVIPDVYHLYKKFQAAPIHANQPETDRTRFSDQEYESLIETARIYGKYVTSKLVSISHRKCGAWDISFNGNYRVIPNHLIAEEFKNHGLNQEPDPTLYDRITSGMAYTDTGVPIFPHEDDDDDNWPEYDEI